MRPTCHCGACELHVTPTDGLANARRRACSSRRRRGAMNATVRNGDLRGAALVLHRLETGVARRRFCHIRGIYTHHRRRSDPGEYGINVGGPEGVNPRHPGPVPWSDGINHPSDAISERAN
nr:hypothetical protein [Oceaniovalibus guishaninsula]